MQEYQKLIKRVEDRREERSRIKAREADKVSHIKSIQEAKKVIMTGFWCTRCKKDYEADGYKHVGSKGDWAVAWYTAKCLCGCSNIRRITDKSKDLYYFRSKMIKTQRLVMSNDMLTPTDPLFKIIYPKQWKEYEQTQSIR